MKSYIKIYGPPTVKALRALEKIAVESPEVLISSYYDAITPSVSGSEHYGTQLEGYFAGIPIEVPEERKSKLISKSGQTLGEYDFFFEWARDPSWKEVEDLVTKIDEALAPLGCKYTIVTK